MAQFNIMMAEINHLFDLLKKNNNKIAEDTQIYYKEVSPEREKETRKNVELLITQNEKFINDSKQILDNMKKDSENTTKEHPEEPESRTKVQLHLALSRELQDVLKMSFEVQNNFKKGVEEKNIRHLRIGLLILVKPTATDLELEELSKNPDRAEQVLQEVILGRPHQKLVQAVSDIREKYEDILKLARVIILFRALKNFIKCF